MVRTRKQIVADIERRNELRRGAGLPALDIPNEIEREQDADQLRGFNDGARLYAADFHRMSDEVWQELRLKNGPAWGGSPSTRWAVGAVLGPRFREFLAVRGFVAPPERSVIRYGGNR